MSVNDCGTSNIIEEECANLSFVWRHQTSASIILENGDDDINIGSDGSKAADRDAFESRHQSNILLMTIHL